MANIKKSKPFDAFTGLHTADEKTLLSFINTNSDAFGALRYLGAFAENLTISREMGLKADNNFILVEREAFASERPGTDYEKSTTATGMFDYSYNLPDESPKKPTEKKEFVLLDTIQTHRCSPSETCVSCKGGGRCRNCFGKGYSRCTSCGGSGTKKTQDGTYANGSPKFKSSSCWSCMGDGRRTCGSCSGSGACAKCGASGKVTCSRCNGTAAYQSFTAYSSIFRPAAASVIYSDYPELEKAIAASKNAVVFDDDLAQWDRDTMLLFDNRARVAQLSKHGSTLSSNLDALAGITPKTRIGRVHSRIENVPLLRLDYTFEEKPYRLFIVGDDNIVCYDSVPEKHSYRQSFFRRIINFFTKKKRQLAFMYIAAYVFGADGTVDAAEREWFETLLAQMNINNDKKALVLEALNQKAAISAIEPYVKIVSKDRRALVFAWHCAITNSTEASAEAEAFNTLAQRFNIDEAGQSAIKNKARQFSGLTTAQMLEEYFR